MGIQPGGRLAPERDVRRSSGVRGRSSGRRTVAGVLALIAVMGVLGWILGFASQAFIVVEVAAMVLILALAVRMDPGRYRGKRHGGGEQGGGEQGADTDGWG